uniref:Uncharacterized protein n=1 Tax=Aegilops tauschii subsp. strangulata TaxID=200361 RepID=A0A453RR95_AEGTS
PATPMRCCTSSLSRSTVGSRQTVVAASRTSLTMAVGTTWFRPSVEQVVGVVAVYAGDASRMTSRTSWGVVVEQETSGTGADEACVVVEAVGLTSGVTMGGSPTRATPNTALISSALAHNLSRYHNNCSLADIGSHSGGKSAGMASSPVEQMNRCGRKIGENLGGGKVVD